ncbi:alpha amylase family protein [Bacillus sinesaloumensis]|uniref:alpha amylase family protein n=1 Tax=Litchfieldia sinesaloumensis TaxID=1926280 RepID=UPI00098848A1|nr:alpha amylase family protein [Bacillus sinesaloumensis]
MKKIFVVVTAFLLLTFSVIPVSAKGGNDTARKNVLQNIVKEQDKKARMLWYDLSANIEYLNTKEKVKEIVGKTAKANIDTIILDIKNSTGFVAYNSDLAPHASTSKKIDKFQGYPENYDLLENVIEEAHKYGIKVHAAINVFSEGSTTFQEGPAYENPEWQSVIYEGSRVATAANNSTRKIDGSNITRNTNYLVLYTPDKYEVSPANRWGAEIQVTDGVVTQVSDRNTYGTPALEVPENGYVLSGHGTARTWLLDNVKVGDVLDISATETKLVPSSQAAGHSTFVNPIREDVQNYELGIIEELVTNYDVDGIVLDRARYNNIYADFSELSREKFEAYIGREVANFPQDIFEIKFDNNGQQSIEEGPLYQKWIEWRAGNIQSFFKKAQKTVHDLKEDVYFSTYVGAWYSDYYSEGVNWASKTYQPDYSWTSPDYHKTGYAETLDFIMTGTYFEHVTKEEAIANGRIAEHSVEGSAELAMDVINESTFVYGSLYLNQYSNNPDQFRKALRKDIEKTHGVMLFDLVYLEWFDWWHIVEEEFAEPSQAPHHIPGFLKMVRSDT